MVLYSKPSRVYTYWAYLSISGGIDVPTNRFTIDVYNNRKRILGRWYINPKEGWALAINDAMLNFKATL